MLALSILAALVAHHALAAVGELRGVLTRRGVQPLLCFAVFFLLLSRARRLLCSSLCARSWLLLACGGGVQRVWTHHAHA